MATVRDVLARKGANVVTVPPQLSVLDAARLMNERGIGGVPVLERGELVGIFTERDVLRRVVAEQRDPAATPVSAAMTAPVLTCTPATTVEECGAIMTTRRIRHLPVIDADGGALAGVVTIGDLLALQVAEQEATIQELNRFIYDLR